MQTIKPIAYAKNIVLASVLFIIFVMALFWVAQQGKVTVDQQISHNNADYYFGLLTTSAQIYNTEVMTHATSPALRAVLPSTDTYVDVLAKQVSHSLKSTSVALLPAEKVNSFSAQEVKKLLQTSGDFSLSRQISIDNKPYLQILRSAKLSEADCPRCGKFNLQGYFWQLTLPLHHKETNITFILLVMLALLFIGFIIILYHMARTAAMVELERRARFTAEQKKREYEDAKGDLKKLNIEFITQKRIHSTLMRENKAYTEDLEKTKKATFSMLQDIDQARKQANLANKSKSIFLASMSHEIRTPLNGVLGMLQLVLESQLTREQRDYLETAHSSGEVLLALLNDILDLSKIEAGGLALENAEFSLIKILEETLILFAEKAHRKEVELSIILSPDLPEKIIGDSGRIRQVIANLLSNAIKFTDSGCVVFHAQLLEQTNAVCHLKFSITDSGIGIEKEAIENLFKPFSQADSSITRRFGGTGLGLSVSRQLVQAMGGDIVVTSEAGKGSTFSFDLSCQLVEEKSEFIPFEKLKQYRVLALIDLDETYRAMDNYLQAWEIDHRRVNDVEEVMTQLTELTTNKPALEKTLLMVDSKEKGVDKALTRQISEDSNLVTVPIIKLLMTTEREKEAEYKQAGVSHIIIKPLRRKALHDSLVIAAGYEDTLEKSSGFVGSGFDSISQQLNLDAKILIAEDNVVNQKVAKAVFKKVGFSHIDIVNNGQEAVDAFFSEISYDVIFMDIQMPVKDGFTATREIRRTGGKAGATLPIIALTAHSFAGEQDKCFDAGMVDYLGKPIEQDRLLIVLKKWVGKL